MDLLGGADEGNEPDLPEFPVVRIQPPIPRLEVHEKEFAKQLQQYWALTRSSLGEVVRDEMRLLTIAAAGYTPPFSGKQLAKMGNTGWSENARHMGENAIERDLRFIFIPVTEMNLWYTAAKFREAWEKQDTVKIQTMLRDAKRFSGKAAIAPDPAFHRQQRRFPRGSVRRGAQWQAIVNPGALENYIAAKQKRVGYAKSGWKAAAVAFGAKLPKWVTRHNGRGSAIDDTRGTDRIHAVIANEIPRLQKEGRDLRIMELALQGRSKALEKKVRETLRERAGGLKKFEKSPTQS